MTHPEYGQKYACFQCGTKFYTMGAPKPLCPKCGSNQRKAPKRRRNKVSRRIEAPDFDREEDTSEEDISDFPIKEEVEEPFDPESDHLSVNDVPDQEY